jgi:hypothetical protein
MAVCVPVFAHRSAFLSVHAIIASHQVWFMWPRQLACLVYPTARPPAVDRPACLSRFSSVRLNSCLAACCRRFVEKNLLVEITSSARLQRLFGWALKRHTIISYSLYIAGWQQTLCTTVGVCAAGSPWTEPSCVSV